MIKQLSFLFLISSSFSAYSQFNETIRTDRPGQSIVPFAVGQGVFQVQSGVDYFGSSNNPTLKNTGFLSNTVIRYGLTEPFEINAQIEYKGENLKDGGVQTSLTGWSALDIGMRYNIYSGEGYKPSVGFNIRLRIPRVGGDYSIDQLAPRAILVTSQSLSDKFSLTTNWGGAWSGFDGIPKGLYTANIAYSATPKMSIFIENYGNIRRSDFNTYFDTGLGYLITSDLQLDLSGGYAKNEGVNEFFISGGISWRAKRK